MPKKLDKGDFIEIEFSGATKDGNVFDSNIDEELKKLDPKAKAKPFVFSLGHSMFLKGIEDFLIGKEVGEYKIELSSDKAFGKRDTKLIQRMPIKVFSEQKLNPVPGTSFNFDGKIGRVLASSGGRVLVDFNNPLAGKDVVYKIKIKRIVDDINEKVKALNDFLFRKELEFSIDGKKLTIKVEKQMLPYLVLFKEKYKEVLDLDLVAEEISKKEGKSKEEKKSSN